MSDAKPLAPAIDIGQGQFWLAIGLRATGCTIVTAEDANGPAGFLGLSATHLGAAPPMMMVSVGASTSALATIKAAGHFALNYVCQGDEELADIFGGKSELKGADRFRAGDWTTLTTGAPVLVRTAGVLDCELDEIIERHGSIIAIGRLVNFSGMTGDKPLVMYRGTKTTIA